MNNGEIFNEWDNFVNKYSQYFRTNEEKWIDTLFKVEQFIKDNAKKPNEYKLENEEKILTQWICTQNKNYKSRIRIMEDNKIYDKWTTFINKYIIYFSSNIDNWDLILKQLEQFILQNKRMPNKRSIDNNEKKLSRWLGTQKLSYKNKTAIMKDQYTYDTWSAFIKKYNIKN